MLDLGLLSVNKCYLIVYGRSLQCKKKHDS